MANMSLKKMPMPVRDPQLRATDFKEVALGYSEDDAIQEANRCLQCLHKPCVGGCPVGVPIPEFIACIQNHDFRQAYSTIKTANSLPAICGRVCPQENQCEKYCVRGVKGEPVGIGRLERFAADYQSKTLDELVGAVNEVEPSVIVERVIAELEKDHTKSFLNTINARVIQEIAADAVHQATETISESIKSRVDLKEDRPASRGHVAVVGSGPAGLTCAGELNSNGFTVTIFEAFHTPGGVLAYGIPEFRLPKSIVRQECDNLRQAGVVFTTNAVIGRTLTIDELLTSEGYDAVFVASGAGLPNFLEIPGESALGVYSANEFLTRVNLMKAYLKGADTPIYRPKRCVVIGGGNVAMDAARCAKRLGADVHIVYRRTMAELPARHEEVEHAEEEGIIFDMLRNPLEILTDENERVRGLLLQKMELGEIDGKGRRRPVPIEGATEEIECDCVIVAVGTSPNPLIASTTPGLETDRHGCVHVVDESTGATSKLGVFAGGDIATGAATVILAMGAGKAAASAIERYISEK
ncbi:MAG: FAD-dependent oxidoreductase [Oscillospiraceae bacterium]|jgi:glutamate synthase (NADPH/NADH) small chain|nr:FAD-dependent oxidoreductase [Oscillospiraceae bacterium]